MMEQVWTFMHSVFSGNVKHEIIVSFFVFYPKNNPTNLSLNGGVELLYSLYSSSFVFSSQLDIILGNSFFGWTNRLRTL